MSNQSIMLGSTAINIAATKTIVLTKSREGRKAVVTWLDGTTLELEGFSRNDYKQAVAILEGSASSSISSVSSSEEEVTGESLAAEAQAAVSSATPVPSTSKFKKPASV